MIEELAREPSWILDSANYCTRFSPWGAATIWAKKTVWAVDEMATSCAEIGCSHSALEWDSGRHRSVVTTSGHPPMPLVRPA